jgi:hypothetical protein
MNFFIVVRFLEFHIDKLGGVEHTAQHDEDNDCNVRTPTDEGVPVVEKLQLRNVFLAKLLDENYDHSQ